MQKSLIVSRKTILLSGILSVMTLPCIFMGCSKSKSNPKSPADSLNAMDRTFLTDASFNNYDEIDASKLVDSGSNAEVKVFGQDRINDHRVIESDLGHIADSFQVPIPAMPDSANVININKLKARSGHSFDTLYMHDMIIYDQGAISLYQKELNTGQSSRLKDFANKYLPKLQRDLTTSDSIMVVLQQH